MGGQVIEMHASVEQRQLRTADVYEVGDRSRTVELVSIAELTLDGSPRLSGADHDHIQTLAEVYDGLPPILVHRSTMRVLDGVHRVEAAKKNGRSEIAAIVFEGEEAEAYVLAVEANVRHGLPLSLKDRQAAAERILLSHAAWSDRKIATTTGLSPSTIGVLRRATMSVSPSSVRVGWDGRTRPLDPSQGRIRAAHVIAAQPHASLREIARSAGISLGTAQDVKRRLREGLSPLPASAGPPEAHPARPAVSARTELAGRAPNGAGHAVTKAVRSAVGRKDECEAPTRILERLRQDPALRYKEKGRQLLQWLTMHVLKSGDWQSVADAVPPHCLYSMIDLAAGCASAWEGLADVLRVQLAEAELDVRGNLGPTE